MQHAMRMRPIILTSVTCQAYPYFYTLLHKRHDFSQDKLLRERERCCKGRRRTEYAVTVKRLLSGSVRGLACRKRKEGCEEKRKTE
jgi:hypothetical protein